MPQRYVTPIDLKPVHGALLRLERTEAEAVKRIRVACQTRDDERLATAYPRGIRVGYNRARYELRRANGTESAIDRLRRALEVQTQLKNEMVADYGAGDHLSEYEAGQCDALRKAITMVQEVAL